MPYRSAHGPLSQAMAAVASRDALRAEGAALEAQLHSLRRERAEALQSLRSAGRAVGPSPPRPSPGSTELEHARRRFERLDGAARRTKQAWAKTRTALAKLGDVDRNLRQELDQRLQQVAELDPALSDHLHTMLAELARGLDDRERWVHVLRLGDTAVSALIFANGQLRSTLGAITSGIGAGRSHLDRCAAVLEHAAEAIAELQRRLRDLGEPKKGGLMLLPFVPPKHWSGVLLGRAATLRHLHASRDVIATVRTNLVEELGRLRSRARAQDQRLTALWDSLCRTAAEP